MTAQEQEAIFRRRLTAHLGLILKVVRGWAGGTALMHNGSNTMWYVVNRRTRFTAPARPQPRSPEIPVFATDLVRPGSRR